MTSSGTTPSRPDLLVVIRTRPVFQHIACFGASVSVISQPRQRPQRQTAMLPVCRRERVYVCIKDVCVCVCVCVELRDEGSSGDTAYFCSCCCCFDGAFHSGLQ